MLHLNVRIASIFIFICFAAQSLNAGSRSFASQNFEYSSDSPLEKNLQEEIMEAAEATRQLLAYWSVTPQKRLKIKLYRDESRYLDSGGIEGSAGVHCSLTNEVLLQLEGQSEAQLSRKDERVLIHEVTHQVLRELLEDAPPWLNEGIAVYVESIPYQAGVFFEERIDFRQAPILRGQASKRIRTQPLATLLRSERSDWNAHFARNLHGVDRQYQTAYLMTYYLVHLSAAPSSHPLRQFLQSLSETLETSGSAAQTFRTGAHRLSAHECKQFEEAMIRAYQKLDVTVEPLNGHRLR